MAYGRLGLRPWEWERLTVEELELMARGEDARYQMLLRVVGQAVALLLNTQRGKDDAPLEGVEVAATFPGFLVQPGEMTAEETDGGG